MHVDEVLEQCARGCDVERRGSSGGGQTPFQQRWWRALAAEYRPGPFTIGNAPLYGSTRFRPPEHLHDGATSDERSTVFQLGRCAQVLLDTGDLDGTWRASPKLATIAAGATAADPGGRYPSVVAFVDAWRAARGDRR